MPPRSRGGMGTDLCFYFQVHQPWRLRPFRFLDVGKGLEYFDEGKNSSIMRKVAHKCYLPMNNLLHELILELKGDFKVSFSITGTALEQMDAYCPEAIASFRRLLDTGSVELLSETSHHSLAALFSPEEFKAQVSLHRELCERLLGHTPSKVFRNTELITSDAIAKQVEALGFEAMCMEGADHILRWRSPLFKYRMEAAPKLRALMKNYRLSDDIAFRFSDRGWSQWPLTSEKYCDWVSRVELENPVSARGGRPFIGLFMDYETFGEHQWASTGIFDFMRALPARLLAAENVRFITPSEAVALARTETWDFRIEAPAPFSWADIERDLSAWQGNPIQDAALRAAYRLEPAVRAKARALGEDGPDGGAALLETWRRLLTSDHYYYMCTKYFADGDVHKYFNPYDSPYDAHIIFMNVMADLARRCDISVQGLDQESA
jgi:alpha-amylase